MVSTWDFISTSGGFYNEISDIFKAFYDGNNYPTSFNRAFIASVPKTARAKRFGEFQPISLINGTQKIISNVLANRFKEKICDLIDLSQSASYVATLLWIVLPLSRDHIGLHQI